MKRISERIILVAGIAIVAAATWFAAKKPASAPITVGVINVSSSEGWPSTSTDTAIISVTNTIQNKPPIPVKPKTTTSPSVTVITITAPSSSADWIIGQQNTISWNRPAGMQGQLYLVNATNGVVAGWIQQNIDPEQTYFPWNTRDLFLNEISSLKKDVTPGEYFLRMSFSSPEVPMVTSAPFWIIASTKNS